MRYLKNKLIFYLAKKLLPLVEAEDIISFAKSRDGVVAFLGKQKLSSTELASLQAEARFLEQSGIWKAINNYFDSLAKKKMFNQATDITDLVFAKTMLYTLSVQRTIVTNILNASHKDK